MKSPLLTVITALLVISGGAAARAQTAAVKTNAIGWATATLNTGAEIGVGRKSTVQVFGALNPFDLGKDKHLRFWTLEPEYRYWLCEKFNGHFFGIHALGGQYNFKNMNFPFTSLPDLTTDENKGRHIEGWYVGAGITYGYQWMLARHWNLEASIGIGYAYSPYKLYGRCDRIIEDKNAHYFGPTKIALSIMYVF